jgi:hypothetical protein
VVALAASGGESTPTSKSEAVGFSRAVNLRAADVASITMDKKADVLGTERVSNVNHATAMADCGSWERKFKGVIEVTRRSFTSKLRNLLYSLA